MIATLIGSSLLACACALVTAWPASDSRGERVAEILLSAIGLAIGLVQVLGFAGLLRSWIVTVAAVSCGIGGLLVVRGSQSRVRQLVLDLRAGISALKRSPPLLVAALLGGMLASRALALPELSWDGLTYHLTYPAFWLQHAGFGRFEAGGVWEQYESFPKGGEALFFLAMLPGHADTFVHWVNVPLWLGIAIAVRAAALRLGARPIAADTCAAIVVVCPALSAYVTPAYVEVPMTFAACVALTAALRASISRDAGALTPMWFGLGLAAAIKVTALAFLPLGLLVTLFAMQALTPRTCLPALGRGVLLAAAVACPWYLHNLVQCGNPLYPAGLPGFAEGPAAGTLANVWAVRESSVLSQAAIGDVFDHLAKPPWRVRYPLGPGWLFLGALPLSIALSVWVMKARAEPRTKAAGVLAALAFGLSVLYAISPWNGVFREANTRFLMPAVIVAVLSLAASATRLPAQVGRTLAALGCTVVLVALGSTRLLRDGVVDYRAALVVAAIAATGALCLHRSRERRLRGIIPILLVAAVGGVAFSFASRARDERRYRAYVHAIDLHPIATSPQLWRFVDSLPPSRIAFSVGDVNATEGWFFYPLFGARLQHAVRYVDIEETDSPACVRRGLIRDRPNERAWRHRLRDQEVEYLVLAGRPIELGWARADPKAFRLVLTTNSSTVFQVDRSLLTQPE